MKKKKKRTAFGYKAVSVVRHEGSLLSSDELVRAIAGEAFKKGKIRVRRVPLIGGRED